MGPAIRRGVRGTGMGAMFALVASLVLAPGVATPATARAVEGDFGSPLVVQSWPLPTGGAGLVSASQGPAFGQRAIVYFNGAMWFGEEQAGKIGRVDAGGNITEYSMPSPTSNPGYGPRQLSAATETGLWFLADGGALDGRASRFNVQTGEVDGFHDVDGYARFSSMTATPDGGAWVTDFYGEGLTRLTPTGAVQADFDVSFDSDAESSLGADGNLWFSDGSSVISRITDAGTLTNFPATGEDGEIVSMSTSGGSVWYSKFSPGSFFTPSRGGLVGRMSSTGIPTPFASPYPDLLPASLTPAADGGVWFTTHHGAGVGHVDPGGTYRVALLPEGNTADSVAAAPDGNLWYTDSDLNRVGVITAASFAVSINSQTTTGTPPPPGGRVDLAKVAGKKGKITANRRLTLRVACPDDTSTCRGKAVVKKKKLTVAKGRFVVKAGQTRAVKVKLSKKGTRVLRGQRRSRLTVVLTSADGSTQRTVVFSRRK